MIERGLGIDYRALYASRGAASAGNFAAGMARLADELGREPEPDELEPLTWAILKAGKRQTGADVMRSLQETRMLNYKTLAAFSDIDVYLCPVMGQPVPEIGYDRSGHCRAARDSTSGRAASIPSRRPSISRASPR